MTTLSTKKTLDRRRESTHLLLLSRSSLRHRLQSNRAVSRTKVNLHFLGVIILIEQCHPGASTLLGYYSATHIGASRSGTVD